MPANFPVFSKAVNLRLQQLTAQHDEFYKVNCPEIFNHYLAAFPTGTNPIFRERTEHDCQCCKQFIRNLGLLVVIEDGALQTVWGKLGDLPAPYGTVAAAMDELVKSSPILSVFRTNENKFGVEKNFDSKSDIVWHHFYGDTPRRCVVSSPGEQIGSIGSMFRGDLHLEQLWDMPLSARNGFSLDAVAVTVNRELKSMQEESFVEVSPNPRRGELEAMLEIVKTVIAIKQQEAKQKAEAESKTALKRQIREAIETKKQEGLASASLEELQAKLAELEAA